MGSGRLPAASTWTPERPGRISSGRGAVTE